MGRAIMGPQATGGFQAPEPYVPESAKAAGALYEAGLAPPVIEAAMQSQISHPASGPNFNEAPTSTPDFSKYEAGFREYQKQNPVTGTGGKAMQILPGGLRLNNTGESKQFSDYMKSIGDNSYGQYMSNSLAPSIGPLPQATTYNLPGTIGSSIPIPTAAEPAPFDPVAYRNQFKPDSGGLASVAQPTPPPQEITLFNESSVQPKGYETGGPTVEFLPQRGGPASRGQQMPSFYQQPMPMMPQPFNPMGYGPMGMGMNRFMNPYGGLGGMAYNFMNRPMPLYGQGGQFTAGQYQAPEPTTPTQPSFGFSPYGGFGYF